MREINYDAIEIVHNRNAVMEHSRRRAAENRRRQIEKIVDILYKLVVTAGILMVMAGACVIDGAPTAAGEFSGVIMMFGGIAVVAVSAMLYQEGGSQL